MMEAVLGAIPKAMAQASKGTHNCFVGRDSRLNWPADASKRSIRCDPNDTLQLHRESSLCSTSACCHGPGSTSYRVLAKGLLMHLSMGPGVIPMTLCSYMEAIIHI